jgi:hypothetical protein
MKRYFILCVCVLILSLGFTLPVFAHIVPAFTGLYNTGVDDAGLVLDNGTNDTHYVLTSSPLGASGTSTVIPFPGAWVTPPTGSSWIGPQSHGTDGLTSDPAGVYSYTLTFSLAPGLDPRKTEISGYWAVDNSATLYLNGIYTNVTNGGFNSLAYFDLTSNFITGKNIVEFRVTNDDGGSWGNPSGLLVSGLQGKSSPVPLPAAMWLLGPGLVGLLGLRRKFSK